MPRLCVRVIVHPVLADLVVTLNVLRSGMDGKTCLSSSRSVTKPSLVPFARHKILTSLLPWNLFDLLSITPAYSPVGHVCISGSLRLGSKIKKHHQRRSYKCNVSEIVHNPSLPPTSPSFSSDSGWLASPISTPIAPTTASHSPRRPSRSLTPSAWPRTRAHA